MHFFAIQLFFVIRFGGVLFLFIGSKGNADRGYGSDERCNGYDHGEGAFTDEGACESLGGIHEFHSAAVIEGGVAEIAVGKDQLRIVEGELEGVVAIPGCVITEGATVKGADCVGLSVSIEYVRIVFDEGRVRNSQLMAVKLDHVVRAVFAEEAGFYGQITLAVDQAGGRRVADNTAVVGEFCVFDGDGAVLIVNNGHGSFPTGIFIHNTVADYSTVVEGYVAVLCINYRTFTEKVQELVVLEVTFSRITVLSSA